MFFSCGNFKDKQEHLFIYGFENRVDLQKTDVLQTIKIIQERLDKYGVHFEVSSLSDDNIRVKIWEDKLNDERVNKLILNQGKLEFWECYKTEEFYPFLLQVDSISKNKLNDKSSINSMFSNKLIAPDYQNGPVLFYAKEKDTTSINSNLNSKKARALLPLEFSHVKFLWGIKGNDGNIPCYTIKSNPENKASITGKHIVSARQNYDARGNPTVSLKMNNVGASHWELMTKNAYLYQSFIAIVLNDIVFSAPGVSSGSITGGRSEISGDFTLEEAQDLANVISSNKIPKLNLLKYSKSN